MSAARFRIAPGGRLSGRLRVPGDKSISHRALMLGAIADGETRISGFLESADCLATLRALRALGVAIEARDNAWTVAGVGREGLVAPNGALDLGNGGTALRLLAGLLVGQAFDTTLTGDASLRRRPMGRIVEPLTRMGAAIAASKIGGAPLVLHGGRRLAAIDYASPVASAQVKSCLLLAGLYADGTTRVREPGVSRDHTERMLGAFGVPVARDGAAVAVSGGQRLDAVDVAVPADLSSAAFFLVGASIGQHSDLWLADVGLNPTRRGVVDCLLAMGADIDICNERVVSGEPVADLHVRAADLRAIDMGAAEVELAIDELPALCIAAACARGTTRVAGAAELRVKESDRIAGIADGLAALGASVSVQADGLTITGSAAPTCFRGARLQSHGDHRLAMAFAVAALRAGGAVSIDDCGPVDTSFPGFADRAADVGLAIERA